MHKNRSRSNSGTRTSCACASTRRLKASRLSSRQRKRSDRGMAVSFLSVVVLFGFSVANGGDALFAEASSISRVVVFCQREAV